MKTTEEYLFEMAIELGNMPQGLSNFKILQYVNEMCAKYALLIDAIKIIKKDD